MIQEKIKRLLLCILVLSWFSEPLVSFGCSPVSEPVAATVPQTVFNKGEFSKMELSIRKDVETLMWPLAEEEFATLEQSILKEGLRDKIILAVLGDEEFIIDGHHRYRICKTHGIEITEENVTRICFPSISEVEEWIIDNQIGRRNLTVSQRCEIGLRIEARYLLGETGDVSGEWSKFDQKKPSDRQIVKRIGVSKPTYEHYRWIAINHAETLDEIRILGADGRRAGISAVYNRLRRGDGFSDEPELITEVQLDSVSGSTALVGPAVEESQNEVSGPGSMSEQDEAVEEPAAIGDSTVISENEDVTEDVDTGNLDEQAGSMEEPAVHSDGTKISGIDTVSGNGEATVTEGAGSEGINTGTDDSSVLPLEDEVTIETPLGLTINTVHPNAGEDYSVIIELPARESEPHEIPENISVSSGEPTAFIPTKSEVELPNIQWTVLQNEAALRQAIREDATLGTIVPVIMLEVRDTVRYLVFSEVLPYAPAFSHCVEIDIDKRAMEILRNSVKMK